LALLLTDNSTVTKFIKGISIRNPNANTAYDYKKRLESFRKFVLQQHNISLDELILTLTTYSHGPKIDVYNLLSDYIDYIQKEKRVSPLTIKLLVSTVRSYLETFDVEISPRKFKFKVITPRVIRSDKESLSKPDIQTILNACHSIKLKSYVLFLAVTGCRAVEALSIRLCDINFETAFIRGECTKTKKDRTLMLTNELAQQLKLWIDYKHRTRTINHYDPINKKSNSEIITPKINNEVFIFSSFTQENPTLNGLYMNLLRAFEQVQERLGGKFAAFENVQKRRRKITFHSMRRFVKGSISDLGYSDFSEYVLGHLGSTYYRRSAKDRAILFRKIEPYLTYLDQQSLERRGADLTNRLEIMERENQELKHQMQSVTRLCKKSRILKNKWDLKKREYLNT
jgi:integrase